jgi:hypothetical protein
LEETEILISGDSHTRRALDPKRLGSAVNISQQAEPYVITYWKLRYLFRNHRPKYLLLGFSQHNLSGFNDKKFSNAAWSSEMFRRTYLIGNYLSLKNIDVDYVELLMVFMREMCLFPHLGHYSFVGNYINSNHNNLSNPIQTIQRHFYFGGEKQGVSRLSLEYLDRIVSLCRKYRVIPILVGSPVHPKYYRVIPYDIKQYFSKIKEKYRQQNILVLDYTDEVYDDDMFFDPDHLNAKGARRFTDKIKKWIRALESTHRSVGWDRGFV